MSGKHYYRLLAVRHSTQTGVVQFISLQHKEDLDQAMMEFLNSLGPEWNILPVRISKQYYDMMIDWREKRMQWLIGA